MLSEQNPELGDALNGLTLAMAENEGADLMTICSTCQGVLSQHNYHLKNDQARMDRANATIADQGFRYGGTTKVKHLLWMLFEDIGIDRVASADQAQAHRLKIAPFYGCYILRPVGVARTAREARAQDLSRASDRAARRRTRRVPRRDEVLRLSDG